MAPTSISTTRIEQPTPPAHLSDTLRHRLHTEASERHAESMHRKLTPVPSPGLIVERDGRALVNLASNDYLGLSRHPRLVDAARQALAEHGVGSGASPLAGGYSDAVHELERRVAAFKHAEAAVLLPTGFAANLALLTTLARPGDLVAADALNHASLFDAARMSGATLRTFPHTSTEQTDGLAKLERLLDRHAGDPAHADACRFIVTDAVFSMDGDAAPLPALADLADKYHAHLIVDEAHATGLLGANGAGLIEAAGVADRVTAANTTASKALGGLGGMITASHAVIDAIVNRARPLIYSTAPPPAQVAAIDAALDVVADEPWRRERLGEITQRVRDAAGLHPVPSETRTPIVPLIAGSPEDAVALSDRFADAGFLAAAIRPPTVKPNTSRVRLSLRADMTDEQVDRLLKVIAATRRPATS